MFFDLLAMTLAASVNTAATTPMTHQSGMTSAERVTLANWTKRVEEALDRQIAYPQFMSKGDLNGTVRVKFNCSENGRPAAVSVEKSSGSGILDRAAVRAVQQISSLHPLPTGMKPDQKYVALVMFGTSEDDRWRRNVVSMRTTATKQNSWFKDATEQADTRLP